MTTPLPKIAEVLRADARSVSVDQGTCRVCGQPMVSYSDLCPACLIAAADACDAAGRLPRTADGKLVVGGDKVITRGGAEWVVIYDGGWRAAEPGAIENDPSCPVDECYSTRAAAKETTDGQA